MMPYNTRRKSLSLPSLGITLPQPSRASQTDSSSNSTSISNSSNSSSSMSSPPAKRVKRVSISAPSHPARFGATPPPSPPPTDTEDGIEGSGDDIVDGVVDVLKRSGNRPHTVKELAVLLMRMLPIVENSANPHAIISSRLNAYLKRGFPGSKCPLAKELITTHPRRIYFYLTTQPALPIPTQEQIDSLLRSALLSSPALSDNETDGDSGDNDHSDDEERNQQERSPSPEVDLDIPDDEAPESPSKQASKNNYAHHVRIMSPPLEGDEEALIQSAIDIKQRSFSREMEGRQRLKRSREELEEKEDKEGDEEVSESTRENKDVPGLVGDLDIEMGEMFGAWSTSASTTTTTTTTAGEERKEGERNVPPVLVTQGMGGEWGQGLQSPESVELDELDDLLGGEVAW